MKAEHQIKARSSLCDPWRDEKIMLSGGMAGEFLFMDTCLASLLLA